MLNATSPARRIYWVPFFVASVYFVVVATMAVAPLLNPDGVVRESPSFVLSLPTSFLILFPMSFLTSSQLSQTSSVLISGIVDAIMLYVLAVRMVNWFGFRITIGIIVLSTLLFSTVAWWANDQDQKAGVRIVNAGPDAAGVWIAANDDGLRVMSDQIISPLGVPSNTADGNLVFVPNKTKGIAKGRRFLLKDGRLIQPYPANTYDMLRDGAVEVERIKITEGSQRGLMGWLPSYYLQRLLTFGSL
jgi:hypothetical protein